jgi:hypothetical protein
VGDEGVDVLEAGVGAFKMPLLSLEGVKKGDGGGKIRLAREREREKISLLRPS